MKYEFNEFYCVKCGSRGIPIARKKGFLREAGHLKKLFCLKCNAETNHAECKENTHYTHDDFLLEFEHHNFDENGSRIMPYSEFKQALNKGEV